MLYRCSVDYSTYGTNKTCIWSHWFGDLYHAHICVHDPSYDEVSFDATCLLVAVGGEGEPVTVSVTGQS